LAALQDAIAGGLSGQGKFLILKRVDGDGQQLYFREWIFRAGPSFVSDFRWTQIISLARAFPFRDQLLAERFSEFIRRSTGIETAFFLVERDRLVKWESPTPRPQQRQIPAQIRVRGIEPKKYL
jgi:hypothetical protein